MTDQLNERTEKLRLIYFPFLMMAVSIIGGYTFLNWLIIKHLQLFQFKEMIVNIFVPFILPWIPVLFWYRKRIKLLKFNTSKNRDPHFIYLFIAVLAIAIPTIIAQEDMETATGKLTELDNISQIDKHIPTKYYSLKNYSIDKKDNETYLTTYVTGKHDESLAIHIYYTCPVLLAKPSSNKQTENKIIESGPLLVINGKPCPDLKFSMIPKEKIVSINKLSEYQAFQLYGEAAKNGAILVLTNGFKLEEKVTVPIIESAISPDTVKSWLGFEYKDQISNNLSNVDQDRLIKIFLEDSKKDFEMKDVSKFIYLKRLSNSDDIEGYQNAISKNPLIQSSKIILLPVNEPFEARNGNKLAWIFGSFGIGAFIWLIMILIPAFEKNELKKIETGEPAKDTDLKNLLTLFVPRKEFFITPVLIDVNSFVFMVMVFAGLGFFSFQADDLIKWGANFKPLTTNGQWWRLTTCTFVHGGIIHLVANMGGLIFVGVFLEPRIGRKKFAVIYLVTGILASITSIIWHEAIVSVGASGAIFGLYGLFLALMLTKVYPKEFNKVFLITIIIFIGYNLVIGISGGIDNAAHLGGLVSGFVIGLFLSRQLKEESDQLLLEKDING